MTDYERALKALGLSPDASNDEIMEAFHDLLKIWDPNRFPDDLRLQRKAHEKRRELNTAYEAIKEAHSSPENRREHSLPAHDEEHAGLPAGSRTDGSSGGTSNIHGIRMVVIPGGAFLMGDDSGVLEKDCHPVHNVKVSEFEMSRYEVTNSQYCAYLNAALASGDITAKNYRMMGAKGPFKGKAYSALVKPRGCGISINNNVFGVEMDYRHWPVVWVTWYGAKAFALYYGLDLPTEAEWEYACRGGRQYRYGTDDGTINNTKANYISEVGPKDVGSYPKNPFGLYDMSGNVWEWCHDWYSSDYYGISPTQDPSGPESGSHRVVRGGGWYYYNDYCQSAFRDGYSPENWYEYVGFRVVSRVLPRNY